MGARSVWEGRVTLTAVDREAEEGWGGMGTDLLPGVLACTETGIAEMEDDRVELEMTVELLAEDEADALRLLRAVVESHFRERPDQLRRTTTDRETVTHMRPCGPEDVPIAESPPSPRSARTAWIAEEVDAGFGDERWQPGDADVATGLFSAHWESRSPYRDYGDGPRWVSMQEAVAWSLQHASRAILRVENEGEFGLGEDRPAKLPDGSGLDAPQRRPVNRE